jgi:hypothetical protein
MPLSSKYLEIKDCLFLSFFRVQRVKQIGISPVNERSEKEQVKRAKQAEAARLR